jgi:hypothetical protein
MEKNTADVFNEFIQKIEVTMPDDVSSQAKLKIIVHQLKNMMVTNPKRKRYCTDSFLTAFIVRNLSSSACDALSVALCAIVWAALVTIWVRD